MRLQGCSAASSTSFDRRGREGLKPDMNIAGITQDSIRETERLRDFKAAGTQGLLECKIQSIIIPLLGDHVLREANHYLCLMGMCRG